MRVLHTLAVLAFMSATALAASAAQPNPPVLDAASPSAAPNDYSQPSTWLCRPGQTDACAVDLSTTVIAADGRMANEPFLAATDPAIDCFYVYPTVSLDPTPNSDMQAGPEELAVIRAQFARFASVCRTFAPLYRQFTLTGLRAAMSGQAMNADRALGYNDVLAAWNHYLQHDNQGRGVVLIGHSQGSGVLTRLIAAEIDGQPVQDRIVSALLLGSSVQVPAGKDVGGSFKHLPLCRSTAQTGCVITYASFRDNVPPPDNSRFGRTMENTVSACTNPAALGGGSGDLHAYLSASAGIVAEGATPAWVSPAQPVTTPFVSVPGLLTARCASGANHNYLAVVVNAVPSDPRTDTIGGDVVANGQVLADWGLHLIDVHLAMGNLLDIVREQGRAFVSERI